MKRPDPARLLAHELEPGLIALDLLLKRLSHRHDPEGVEACLGEVEALRALVRDFQLDVESRPFSIAALLSRLGSRFAPIGGARRVFLELDGSDAEAMGDARKTERILSNLLSNAVSFSPPGESVVVRTTREGASVVIEVSDRGVGIRPEDGERIFEPFVRLDPGREGSGLGLAFARSLAEAQGGTLTLARGEASGARFTLTLPAA